MSKTSVFPQVEAEQVKAEETKDRYIVYAQCVHMLEAEAREKANATKDSTAEIGGRA